MATIHHYVDRNEKNQIIADCGDLCLGHSNQSWATTVVQDYADACSRFSYRYTICKLCFKPNKLLMVKEFHLKHERVYK